MINRRREKEEHLERLWEMKENGLESVNDLEEAENVDFDKRVIEDLVVEGLVDVSEETAKIVLTESGKGQARRIIRAHRIGERLIYDVFGGDFETAACEFEHTVTPELVDGICTLLGHPGECPHGMPIPEGDCCRSSAGAVNKQVLPLKELEIGDSARVAYINARDDRQMHRLDGLQIRPRTTVKLHQQYPCYVVECEGAYIALDDDIVSSICVWSNNGRFQPANSESDGLKIKRRHRWTGVSLFGRRRQENASRTSEDTFLKTTLRGKK